MNQSIATLLYIAVICGLFWLDRDRKLRTSPGLWVAVTWLLIISSRTVSEWLMAFHYLDAPGGTDAVSAASALEGNPVDRNVYSGLLLIGLIVLIGRRQQVGKLLRANLPIVLFFTYCLVSAVWSAYPDVALKRWIKGLGDIVMVIVLLTDRDREAALKRLLSRCAFVLIPLSILFIKYYPDVGRSYNRWTWTYSYGGVTTNKNTLGMICMLFGVASVWRLLGILQGKATRHRARRLAAHALLLALITWLFYMANSVTSMSCLVLASGILIMAHTWMLARKPALVHLLVVGMIAISFSVLFLGAGAGLMADTTGRDTTTLTGRTEIWKLALSMAGNPVIGTGYESFWLGKRLEKMWAIDPDISQAHNGYLEIYLNLGWVGELLFATILITGYRNAYAAFKRNRHAGSIVLVYLTIAVVYNFTEATFRMTTPIWFYFLFSAIALPPLMAKAKTASKNKAVVQELSPVSATASLEAV